MYDDSAKRGSKKEQREQCVWLKNCLNIRGSREEGERETLERCMCGFPHSGCRSGVQSLRSHATQREIDEATAPRHHIPFPDFLSLSLATQSCLQSWRPLSACTHDPPFVRERGRGRENSWRKSDSCIFNDDHLPLSRFLFLFSAAVAQRSNRVEGEKQAATGGEVMETDPGCDGR